MKSHIERNSEVIWDIVDGITVVCHIATGDFFEFNTTAALVWDLCDGIEIDEVAKRLQERYPHQNAYQIAEDARNFIMQLLSFQLVRLTESS